MILAGTARVGHDGCTRKACQGRTKSHCHSWPQVNLYWFVVCCWLWTCPDQTSLPVWPGSWNWTCAFVVANNAVSLHALVVHGTIERWQSQNNTQSWVSCDDSAAALHAIVASGMVVDLVVWYPYSHVAMMVVHVDLQKGPQLLKMNLPPGPVKALSRKIERLLCFLFCCDVAISANNSPAWALTWWILSPRKCKFECLKKTAE